MRYMVENGGLDPKLGTAGYADQDLWFRTIHERIGRRIVGLVPPSEIHAEENARL